MIKKLTYYLYGPKYSLPLQWLKNKRNNEDVYTDFAMRFDYYSIGKPDGK